MLLLVTSLNNLKMSLTRHCRRRWAKRSLAWRWGLGGKGSAPAAVEMGPGAQGAGGGGWVDAPGLPWLSCELVPWPRAPSPFPAPRWGGGLGSRLRPPSSAPWGSCRGFAAGGRLGCCAATASPPRGLLRPADYPRGRSCRRERLQVDLRGAQTAAAFPGLALGSAGLSGGRVPGASWAGG